MAAPKIRIVLVSHGEQCKGMLNTVQMLLGPQENIAAYCLYAETAVEDYTVQLREEVEKYGAENIVFLSELKQGSPFNALVSLTRDYDLYHLTGTNLAMLMTIVVERDDEGATAAAVCEAAMETASESIYDVRKLLQETAGGDEDEEEDL